jgi:membrane-associated phospholipid phosphatase
LTVDRVANWIDLGAGRVALALALLGAVLGVLARRFETFPADTWSAARIRSLGPAFEPVARIFNEGDGLIAGAVFAGLSIALVVRHQTNSAILVALAGLLRPILNSAKMLVDRPRPSGDFQPLDVVHDSSFPSGHTMTAVVFFGLLFVLASEIVPPRWVRSVRVGSAVAIGLMALSRVWAGVHWPSDTYGALVWSAALVAFVLAFRPTFLKFCSRCEREWTVASDLGARQPRLVRAWALGAAQSLESRSERIQRQIACRW